MTCICDEKSPCLYHKEKNMNNSEQEVKISLYDITEGINKVEAFIDDEEALTEYLDSLNMQLEDKVTNIIRYRRTLELTAEAVSNEIDRLCNLKKYYEGKSENLKKYLSYSLLKIGKDDLETEAGKLSFRKSETTDIIDETLIPTEYKKEKVSITIDKTAVKNAIKDGKEVPGAVITEHKNLQIK